MLQCCKSSNRFLKLLFVEGKYNFNLPKKATTFHSITLVSYNKIIFIQSSILPLLIFLFFIACYIHTLDYEVFYTY